MKITLKIFVLSLITMTTSYSCGSPKKDPAELKNNNEALQEIRTEPKIYEAFLSDADVLYVSVDDDGTRRDGYAEYLCEVIKSHNSTISRVKVVKVNSMKDPNRDNAYGVLLGECWCNN